MAKLGTKKYPVIVRVATEKRAGETADICEANGWKYIVGIEPDEPEDISDIERLLNPPEPYRADEAIGRNEPCPCGSGKKYKKCCGS